jgi:hypothetical protein
VKRRYTFSGDDLSAVRATLCWTAIVKRGDPPEGNRHSAADNRSDGHLSAQFKKITTPIASQPEPVRGQPDLRARALVAGGGTLELEQTDFDRLLKLLDSTQWMGSVCDEIIELIDDLNANAEKGGA